MHAREPPRELLLVSASQLQAEPEPPSSHLQIEIGNAAIPHLCGTKFVLVTHANGHAQISCAFLIIGAAQPMDWNHPLSV